jgi:hypothetical protein
MYGHGYAWDLRKLGGVLNVFSKGNLFYTRFTKTEDFMKIKHYHPSTYAQEPPIHAVLIQNTILQPDYHYEEVPSGHCNKSQLLFKLMPWA